MLYGGYFYKKGKYWLRTCSSFTLTLGIGIKGTNVYIFIEYQPNILLKIKFLWEMCFFFEKCHQEINNLPLKISLVIVWNIKAFDFSIKIYTNRNIFFAGFKNIQINCRKEFWNFENFKNFIFHWGIHIRVIEDIIHCI